ncbi:MAG: hypothetical protein QM478_11710 [Flavobacteriaceae bacterium]
MHKTLFIILVLITNYSFASLIKIQSSTGTLFNLQLSNDPSIVDCMGINSTLINEPITSININKSNQLCVKLVIDNYDYGNMDFLLYHQSKLIVVNNLSLTNCLTSTGATPAIGFGFILSAGSAVLGISQIKIHENLWVLEINSVDGDIVCDGGVPIDLNSAPLIFKNGFEN